MASPGVDQKFLGRFAKRVNDDNPYLSSMLFKILGLSVLLAEKLARARKHRKLDTTRDTKSLRLYHHIIWLAREGGLIMEQYVLPMVGNCQDDLKVLAFKLRASFYHIFVLFHNYPPVTQTTIPTLARGAQAEASRSSLTPDGAASTAGTLMNGGPVGGLPPGLASTAAPKPTSSFLLPAVNYVPIASAYFEEAARMAEQLLPGSHPIRLSVKLEQAAFTHDCLKDLEGSRRLAKHAIADVYNAQEGMDDDAFEDAAELVRVLGRIMRRGRGSTPGSTPGGGSSSTPGSRATPNPGSVPSQAVPLSGMSNFI
ncbi:MAG: hypothetical protein M1823_000256 [Watsoniomyces obsoletus]|nr:MAG: hypothetical protein M1823_000256 [Watsoniomyces obsoletus]